ncbi:MAG: hypothetical protein GC206_05655 [Alphaproteobacteria bacterium]|nr:hypothetical protein [Alphaproteobacteria bacterium]
MNLLIAMDNTALAHAVAKRIAGPACTPVVAETLSDAHAAWARTAFDVALVQSPMPDDETRAIALLCWTRGARVIVTTSFPAALGGVSQLIAFMDADVVEMPFTIAALAERLGLQEAARTAA